MKISNAAEDPATLDMEALAVLHARRADPTLPVALPRVVPGGDPERDGAEAYRTAIEAPDGIHFVRLYDVLPGHGRSDPLALSDARDRDWGEMTARLARALRGFTHPKAAADDALGHPARPDHPADARRHPRSGTPGGRRGGPRPLRVACPPGLAVLAGPVRPHGLHQSTTPWSMTTGGSPGSSTSGT